MSANRKSAPCKNCPNREIGCHGRCEKYLAFVESNEKEINRKQKQKWLNNLYYTKPVRR